VQAQVRASNYDANTDDGPELGGHA
jgi:hypothetical protein